MTASPVEGVRVVEYRGHTLHLSIEEYELLLRARPYNAEEQREAQRVANDALAEAIGRERLANGWWNRHEPKPAHLFVADDTPEAIAQRRADLLGRCA